MGHSDLSTLMSYAQLRPRRRQEALGAMQTFLEDTITDAHPQGSSRSAAAESPTGEGYASIKLAAEILGTNQKMVRSLADAGRLPHWRTTGGQRRFDVGVLRLLREELAREAA